MTISIPRRLFAVVAVAGLFWLAWLALQTSINQLPQRNTLSQSIQVYTELIFGFFAIVVVLMALTRQRKLWIAEVVFVASGALTAGLASIVWGRTSLLLGVVSFVIAGLVAAVLAWMLRVGVRGPGRVGS